MLVVIRKLYIHRHLLLLQVNSMRFNTGRPQSAALRHRSIQLLFLNARNPLRAAEVVTKAGGGEDPAGGMNQRTTTAGRINSGIRLFFVFVGGTLQLHDYNFGVNVYCVYKLCCCGFSPLKRIITAPHTQSIYTQYHIRTSRSRWRASNRQNIMTNLGGRHRILLFHTLMLIA